MNGVYDLIKILGEIKPLSLSLGSLFRVHTCDSILVNICPLLEYCLAWLLYLEGYHLEYLKYALVNK